MDPAYQRLWSRRAVLILLLAAVLVVGGFAAGREGNGSLAAGLLIFAAVTATVDLLTRRGIATTVDAEYALTVGAEGLSVVWRNKRTRLPWSELEYASVVENGPLYRALEVRPRPGVPLQLPSNVRWKWT